MDSWERFDDASLRNKDDFYSNLNIKYLTDVNYCHAKRVFKDFNNKNLGDYHDLYVHIDTLLLSDIFENFRSMCIEIYKLDPAYFLSAPGLAWSICLRMTGVKLELLTDIDMLLMIEKGIRGGICHAIHRHAKANNKYTKNNENTESSYLKYLDANNLYEWAMSKRLPVNCFKQIKNVSKFDEDFTKIYNDDNNKGHILEVDVEYPKNLHDLHSDLPFLPKRKNIYITSLPAIYMTKKDTLFA